MDTKIKDRIRGIIRNTAARRYAGIAGVAILIGLTGVFFSQRNVSAREIQRGIAEHVVRLHVLANSDSEEDQELKMQVKEHVIAYLGEVLGRDLDLEETKEQILLHRKEIETEVKKVIEKQGYSYEVSVALEGAYFPIKTYGDVTFPAGDYEALQIKIGEAKGKNWWCVIYPALCFVDATHSVVPESGKEELKNVLTEEEYETITRETKIKIKFKFIEDLFR